MTENSQSEPVAQPADAVAPPPSALAQSLSKVRARIREAALAAQRPPEQIRLLAVSKRHGAAAIREAYAAGQRDFGENYAQELLSKAEELSDLQGLRWHMIGHLQRNKAKLVVPKAQRVSSVDSERLALELNRQVELLRPAGDRLEVLVEVNLAAEQSKTGCSPAEAPSLIAVVEQLPRLELRGLMAVPPRSAAPEATRGYFDELVRLRDEQGGVARLPELSMGMSDDLELAVAAGSTEVRIGTAIFGERV